MFPHAKSEHRGFRIRGETNPFIEFKSAHFLCSNLVRPAYQIWRLRTTSRSGLEPWKSPEKQGVFEA